jgi:hypothetical protein
MHEPGIGWKRLRGQFPDGSWDTEEIDQDDQGTPVDDCLLVACGAWCERIGFAV